MTTTRLRLPLAPPDEILVVASEPTPLVPERGAPVARPRRGSSSVLAALLVVAAAIALSGALTGESSAPWATARGARPIRPLIGAVPTPAGRPQWPRSEPATTAAAWQPTTLQFPDGSSAALYPDRVRAPAGRPVRLVVERFDPSGAPMSGVLDMELIVETPGREPFKAGLTEHAGAPGTYDSIVDGDALGIGRTDFELIASQSARPDTPVAMAAATTSIEIVGGVRFAGPPVARWQDDHLIIEVPVSTRTATHATVTIELYAGADLLGELTSEADIGEGEATMTLGAGELIAANDPRVAALALGDGTIVATVAGVDQWTDFWQGRHPVAAGGPDVP